MAGNIPDKKKTFSARISAVLFLGITLSIISVSCSIMQSEAPLPPLSEAELRIMKKMGAELLPDQNIKLKDIIIHRREKELSFPCRVNMTEGDLEVLICTPIGRAHESLLVSKTNPFHLQLALYLLGAENGTRLPGKEIPQGTLFNIDVQAAGKKREPVENWLFNKRNSKSKVRNGWVFTGSSFTHDNQCLATEEGNLVNIWSFGNTILDNPSETGDEDDYFSVYTENTPEYETPVTVFLYKKAD